MRDCGGSVHWRVLVLLVLALAATGPVQAAEVTVVFRYDDYSARSNTDLEVRLIDAFGRRGIPLVIGAIPCFRATGPDDGQTLPSDKADILREAARAGIVDVGVHGYSHLKTGWWTELAGLPYEEQLFRLRRGRELLHEAVGIEAETFIPPYNAYDHLTLRAMEQLGYTCLCAGKLGRLDDGSLRFLPSTCGLADARRSIESATRAGDSRIVVILFHGFDLVPSAPESPDFLGWTAFEELLDWVVRRQDVAVRSIRELLDSDVDLSIHRFAANRRLSSMPRLVPSFLVHLFGTETGAYLSTDEARRLRTAKTGLYLATATFYAVLLALGAALTTALRRRFGRPLVLLRRAGIALLVAATAYACQNLTIGVHGAIATSVIGGACLGLYRQRLSRL